jgi:molecular chaperone DnaJ
VTDQVAIDCPTCDGAGQVSGAVCHTCRGAGQTTRQSRLEVKIPAGVKTGSRVRMAAKGKPGVGRGEPGDLYLIVTVTGDADFRREGNDLVRDVSVPVIDAVLGGEVTVQTIDGRVALRIPELTQNGATIRLASKGMPVLGKTDERGALVVRVQVELPEELSEEQRTLFEQLRDAETIDQAAI